MVIFKQNYFSSGGLHPTNPLPGLRPVPHRGPQSLNPSSTPADYTVELLVCFDNIAALSLLLM